MRNPIGGIPGIVPGQMAFGHSSALAGAPSMTGGILSIDSSSLGNLNPASLNALPKSFSLGKSMWHVLQLVPYKRENAGIASALVRRNEVKRTRRRTEEISTQYETNAHAHRPPCGRRSQRELNSSIPTVNLA